MEWSVLCAVEIIKPAKFNRLSYKCNKNNKLNIGIKTVQSNLQFDSIFKTILPPFSIRDQNQLLFSFSFFSIQWNRNCVRQRTRASKINRLNSFTPIDFFSRQEWEYVIYIYILNTHTHSVIQNVNMKRHYSVGANR